MKKLLKNKIFIIGSIVILILGIVLLIVFRIVNDKKELTMNGNVIRDNYNMLIEEVDKYNNVRGEYLELTKGFFYDSFKDEYDKYNNILSRYSDSIKEIDNIVKNIDKKCVLIYKDININKICNSYTKTYEKLVNIYVSDIENYNKKVEGFNEYKNENIEKFVSNYDYIDYNGDNIFEGVEVNEEN